MTDLVRNNIEVVDPLIFEAPPLSRIHLQVARSMSGDTLDYGKLWADSLH